MDDPLTEAAGPGGDLKASIRAKARALGFDAVGFARAELDDATRRRLRDFLADGRHAGMGWLAAREAERGDPATLWPDARTAIVLGTSYAPGNDPANDPLASLARPDRATISAYARRRDYHDVVKGRLKHLAQYLVAGHGGDAKVFVDTAPVMEKPLAARTALGWQGKHSCVVSRAHGSWLFLGELFTTLAVEPDAPHADRCGSCDRCQTVCPTRAFPAPYQLDARRCIAYLTIEHDGPIPHGFRAAIGNRVFGCDDCLAVCPWNRFAAASRDQRLAARDDLAAPTLAEFAAMDDAGFRARFANTPVRRLGHRRFLRNVLVALGNSGDPALLPAALAHAGHGDPVVAEAAAWAAGRLRAAGTPPRAPPC